MYFFFASRRRHTRLQGDWSSDVCSSDLRRGAPILVELERHHPCPDLLDQCRRLAGVALTEQAEVDRQTFYRLEHAVDVPRSEERRVGKEWRSRSAQSR